MNQIFDPCFGLSQKFELLRFFATKVGVGGKGCKVVCMFKLNARHNGYMKNIVSMATRASKLILLGNGAKNIDLMYCRQDLSWEQECHDIGSIVTKVWLNSIRYDDGIPYVTNTQHGVTAHARPSFWTLPTGCYAAATLQLIEFNAFTEELFTRHWSGFVIVLIRHHECWKGLLW